MKKIKLYEEFVGEAYKFYDLFFNSHVDHNPECDILEGHLDKDSLITYGIYIKGPKEGLEFMEYYSGSNYKPTSDKRSNSKLFMVDKIPAKYKAMWEDLKKIYQNEYAGSGRVSTRNEALVVEGQFSWMAQDTGRQIGSERENTITVYMFDDKGQKWEEKKYDGYGEFGGKDYYELLAQMNGVENADRQDGIDIAFGKTKTKGKTLFPALVEDPKRFNYKRHDFTVQPDNDPNQSWYQEEEYDDDDDNYDEYDESKVTEAKALPLDKLTKMIGDKPSCYSLADFVYTNYDKVTGLKKSMRNDEMDFPEEIMDLVDHYGFDVDDFTDKYSMAAESVVIEATSYDPDDIFFLWDDYVDNGREGIERGHTGSGSNKHELFTFDTEVDGYDKFETELKKLLKKSGWKNEYNQDTLKVYENEVNLFDEIGPELEALRNKISILMRKSTSDKWTSALGKALSAISTLDRNLSRADSKLGVVLTEGAMSDIDILAQEAKDFKSFVKEFTKEYHDLSNAGEPGQFKEWLQSVYDNAKANMDESVVTEGKHWHVLSGNTWYTGSDFSTNPADAMKYADIMSATKVAKKVGGMVHVMTDEEMTKAIKKFGKNESVVIEAIKPAGLSKAETKKVAETYAKAIGKNDGVKCTVNLKSLEEDSFDLDIDGEEYAGGSYIITLDGDVINAALPEKPVYGQIDSTVDQIIKNLKK